MRIEHELALALAGGFFAFVLVSMILTMTRQVVREPTEKSLGAMRFMGLAILLLVYALIEELLFRWLLIGQLGRVIGVIPAFLISIIVFGLAHRANGKLNYGAYLNLGLVGVILGLVFLHWGVFVAAAAHAGWNLAEWGLGYTVSGEKNRRMLPSPAKREIRGEPYGPEAHWSATVVMLMVLLILVDIHR